VDQALWVGGSWTIWWKNNGRVKYPTLVIGMVVMVMMVKVMVMVMVLMVMVLMMMVVVEMTIE
jgi:hypothetical protein